MSEAPDQTRVTIDHWVNTFVVASARGSGRATFAPGSEELPRRIRQFEKFVSEELSSCCEQWLPQRIDLTSPAVWHIRALDLRFVVDLVPSSGVEPEQAWGEQVATRISQTIDRGANKDVVCFDSRAAYLAQFALDLAAGRAWDLWYYQQFLALRMLPASRAIAEALTREPEHGADAILNLARAGKLDEVLAILSEHDAQEIYSHSFSEVQGTANPTQLSLWCGRFLELQNDAPMRSSHKASEGFHDALQWLARAALRFPGAERDASAISALNGLLELRRVLAGIRSSLVADRLVRDLVMMKIGVGDAAQEAQENGALSAERGLRFLIEVCKGDTDWAAQTASVLLRDENPVAQGWLTSDSVMTPFGGVFLLGPALVDLQVNQIAEAAATEANLMDELAGLLRHVALVKCFGKIRARVALADTAIRLLSGRCHSDLPELGEQLESLDWASALAAFTKRLAVLTGCDGRCLLLEAVPMASGNGDVLVVRDVASGLCLYATALPDGKAEWEGIVCDGVRLVQAATGNMPHLLLRGELAALAESSALRARCEGLLILDEEVIDGEATEFLIRTGCISDETRPERISRMLASCSAEFAYFSLGDIWPERGNLDLMGTLLASATLKGFASRLKGFTASTPEHLRRNFLEGVSLLHIDRERIEVALPPCPLSLVLQLSGLSRQRYRIPWLDGREIWLQPAKD